ncbi:MAG: hypothetical protein ACYTAO_02445 [Planctomycetota bacterium]|jgi:hypothetical protein
MQFLHQVLVQDETLTASATRTDDLPVNPLTAILVTIKALNNTGTLTDYIAFQNILAYVSRLEVLFQGSAVVSGSLPDLARLSGMLIGRGPAQMNMINTDDGARAITVPILLGRKPYWAKECFPAVRRGELQLQITTGAAPTGADGFVLQAETVELLGATPSHYLKATTISKTPAATGDHDVDLPLGNLLAGIMLFGTTVPATTSYNASIGQVRLLLDNVEAWFARTNWETLRGMASLRAQGSHHNSPHFHMSDLAAAYQQFQSTDENESTEDLFESYAYMDLDPNVDDQYLIDTKGRARAHLRITADAADAIRVLPVELVEVRQ